MKVYVLTAFNMYGGALGPESREIIGVFNSKENAQKVADTIHYTSHYDILERKVNYAYWSDEEKPEHVSQVQPLVNEYAR